MRMIKIMVVVAPVAVAAGAAGSIILTRLAGQFNASLSMFVVFAIWVGSPFVALGLVSMLSRRWSVPTRAVFHAMLLMLAVGSLAIYGNIALMPSGSRSA